MSDDLVALLKDRLKVLYYDPRVYSPGQISEASGMALTRIEELEAKLAKAEEDRDDALIALAYARKQLELYIEELEAKHNE